jgi:anti-sigma factor ChrR (cupin superfamily)
MGSVSVDRFLPLAESFALGTLEPGDRAAFEDHAGQCAACQRAVDGAAHALLGVASLLPKQPPAASVRAQLLDLAEAPNWPLDLGAIAWQEIGPGIRIHTLKEEPERGVRKCLVWAEPGAKNPSHRHGGDECILVLKGGLRDERGDYHAGELCRSREGSVHCEEVLPGEDCVCYVVYYGPLEFV